MGRLSCDRGSAGDGCLVKHREWSNAPWRAPSRDTSAVPTALE